ncbi:MAG TPA: SAM-dependent methyltransferase [Cyclobacteriaceae bacterium]|nr:SAM-dependent methyltransferase [Cyclobacteriaceae bacterium]
MKGKLYLIPNIIAEGTQSEVLTPQVLAVVKEVKIFLAEDVRTARRFLSSLKISVEPLSFHVLNKDTKDVEIPELMRPLMEGHDVGVISESGCPGVADPGAMAVAYAHANDLRVIPLVGPSSLLLALMASGLSGQQFVFHGYLPIEAKGAADALRAMEKESKKKDQTQIFIETPYRNNQLFELMLKTLQKTTLLTVAIDITGKEEAIRTQTVGKWLSSKTKWPKQPAVFLFRA